MSNKYTMTYSKWAGTSTVGGLKHSLKDDADDMPIAWAIWQVEDVEWRAADMGIEVSKEECAGILGAMNDNHDATNGMSWDTIDYWLDELRLDRENNIG